MLRRNQCNIRCFSYSLILNSRYTHFIEVFFKCLYFPSGGARGYGDGFVLFFLASLWIKIEDITKMFVVVFRKSSVFYLLGPFFTRLNKAVLGIFWWHLYSFVISWKSKMLLTLKSPQRHWPKTVCLSRRFVTEDRQSGHRDINLRMNITAGITLSVTQHIPSPLPQIWATLQL